MKAKPSNKRSAIVTGANGQDGFYLVARLLADGTLVHATVRDRSRSAELLNLPGAESLTIHELDVTDRAACGATVARVRPTELYNLAGQTSVSESFTAPTRTWDANASAVESFLEAIRQESPDTTFYQAGSIDMFGAEAGGEVIHDERSDLRPGSPYASAKAAAFVLCDGYRRSFGIRVASGILTNHESRRRPPSFLTRKVVDHVRRLRDGVSAGGEPIEPLALGNLAVRRDWGYAPDFAEGIVRICRQIAVRAEVSGEDADEDTAASYRDYVLATGELHAAWELVDRAFSLAALPLTWDRTSTDPADWSARLEATGAPAVVVDPALVRPSDPAAIGGDPSRARVELGWRARPGLDLFLSDMLDAGPVALSS